MQDKKLDVVDSFCYLGDTIGAGGGCDLSVITRIRSAWGKFGAILSGGGGGGGILSEGFCRGKFSGGAFLGEFCMGGFCQGAFVREPEFAIIKNSAISIEYPHSKLLVIIL